MKTVQALPHERMIGEVLKWIVLLVITFTTTFLHAKIWDNGDKVYSIQIGTFAGVSMEDFKSLKKIGYVYAEPIAGNVDRVFLSKYKNKTTAEQKLKLVKSLGFPDAFVSEQSLAKGKEVSVVQFATLKSYDNIDWSKYKGLGDVAAVFDDTNVKIVAGPFDSANEVSAALKDIRANGYADAFPKKINSLFLHQINTFDRGAPKSGKAVLADAAPEEAVLVARGTVKAEPTKAMSVPKSVPAEYSAARSKNIEAPKRVSKAKRSSMLELQKLMKTEKTYRSSLDGIYGKGTKKGLDQLKKNKQYQKYALLAGMADKGTIDKPQLNSVESAIALIPRSNLAAKKELSSMSAPLAKAYLAYAYFRSKDDTAEKMINGLMNDAIQAAYADFKGKAPFDYTSTYAYVDTDQMLKHIAYIHQVDKTVAAPCWLATEESKAFAQYFAGKIPTKDCGKALDWASLNTLIAVADDLSLTAHDSYVLSTADLENVQKLALTDKTKVKEWHKVLWMAMDDWAKQHAFHAKFVKPLKIAYHESWIQLEDHFINQGHAQADANALALQALQKIVAPRLEAYLK